MIIILSLIVAKVRFTPKDEPKAYTRFIMTMTKVPSTNNDHGDDDHDVDNRWKPMEAFFFPLPGLMKEVLSFASLSTLSSWSYFFTLFTLPSSFPLVLLSTFPPLQSDTVSQEELECSHLSTAPPPSPPASGSPTSPPFQVAKALILKHIGCFLFPGAPTLDPELWTYSKQFYYEAGKDLARTKRGF